MSGMQQLSPSIITTGNYNETTYSDSRLPPADIPKLEVQSDDSLSPNSNGSSPAKEFDFGEGRNVSTPEIPTRSEINHLAQKLYNNALRLAAASYDQSALIKQADEKSDLLIKRQGGEVLPELSSDLSELATNVLGKYPVSGRDWKVRVVNSLDIQAMSFGGGQIVITTGLLKVLKDRSELAAIILHEGNHDLRGHRNLSRSLETVGREYVEDTMKAEQEMLDKRLTDREITKQQYKELLDRAWSKVNTMENLVQSQIGRYIEKQSDLYNFERLAELGYDPRGILRMLKRLDTELNTDESKVSDFEELTSTHPSPSERMSIIQGLIKARGYPPFSEERLEADRRDYQSTIGDRLETLPPPRPKMLF